jgi:cold shock CspA family protein
MAKSSATFSKRENEKKKIQKRKEKDERREERKAQAQKGQSLEDMMVYVDEFGNLVDSPPDPKKKREIKTEEILLGAAAREAEPEGPQTGTVSFYNDSKGYGFIREDRSQNSYFFLNRDFEGQPKIGQAVLFTGGESPRGLTAAAISLKR